MDGQEQDVENPVSRLVTIILTTSPTPSCPSPELVEQVLESLPTELKGAPLIITFDGYSISQNSRVGGRLKKGQIPQTMADEYGPYIKNVKSLFRVDSDNSGSEGRDDDEEVEDGYMHTFTSRTETTCRDVLFIRQKFRQGFGNNVKAALHHVTTPFVLVMQHDWVFTGPTVPILDLLGIMNEETEVRYVVFTSRFSKGYEISRGRKSLINADIFQRAKEMRRGKRMESDLVACLHVFDRPHLASILLYRDIFESGVVKRGDFIEDTYGCAFIDKMTNAPTRDASFQAFLHVGAWMYCPHDGQVVSVRHTSGRTCLAKEQQAGRIQQYIRDGKKKSI